MTIRETEKFKTAADVCHYIMQTGRAGTYPAAKALLGKEIPLESKYQAAIMKYLKTVDGGFFWKEQAGPYQVAGLPDICGVYRGQFYGFEVKRPFIGKVSAIQAETHMAIRQAGGNAHVVTYVSDIKRILGGGKNEK